MRFSQAVFGLRRKLPNPLALCSTLALGLALAPSTGCKDETSDLEKLAADSDGSAGPAASTSQAAGEAGNPAGSSEAGSTAGQPTPDTDGDTPPIPIETELPLDGNGLPIPAFSGPAKLISAGAEDKRVELRLALDETSRYRITTIGMLKLPLFDKAVGFAREEDLRLADCEGEGAERSCLLTHTYRNFEAEPPTGDTLAQDELLVAKLETSHRIDASGLRASETAIKGAAETPNAKALAQIHRFYCIRLPNEAVGLGATWRDVCRNREGGSVVTRELVWRLGKLETSDQGTRAELEYAGRVRRVDPKGEVQRGEIKGSLFFWVDAGEPHLIRERVVFVLDAERGMSTATDLRFQFTKLDDNDELIRTDGRPFEGSPTVLNDPRSVPLGDTRDAEHSGKAKTAKKPG